MQINKRYLFSFICLLLAGAGCNPASTDKGSGETITTVADTIITLKDTTSTVDSMIRNEPAVKPIKP